MSKKGAVVVVVAAHASHLRQGIKCVCEHAPKRMGFLDSWEAGESEGVVRER